MRCFQFWIYCLGLVGSFLFFFHDAIIGQGYRDLIDLTPRPSQPTQSTGTEQSSPHPITTSIGRVLTDLSRNPSAGGGTVAPPNPPGFLGGNLSPITVPTYSGLLRSPMLGTSTDSSADSSQTSAPDTRPKTLAQSLVDLVASVVEEDTEDEREEKEIQGLRQRAEQMSDPEQRQVELDRVAITETNFRNRLARRATDEVNAKLFYFPRLKEQYLKDGWCQLFDGHTDYGWKTQTEGPYAGGKFTFGQNEICSDDRHPGLIYTQIPFGDVSVRFNYWAEKDSEVYLLMKTPPDPADLNRSCYTFVLNSRLSSYPRGIPLGRHHLPLHTLREMRELWDDPRNENEGTWHSVIVKFAKNEYQVWFDKRPPETYFDYNPIASGHIAFLVAKGKVRFRDILWQPNQSVSLFDTQFTNELPWRLSEGTEFSKHEEDIFSLRGGSVESKGLFTNFMLQMEYFQGVNTGQAGLFIRSLPDRENTGYEISLQNFPRQRDREAAVGADAGAFRQFMDARYIRPRNRQWTYLTVVAMGRQFQTWVDGVPVCSIEELRKTLRVSGPFLDPGTIRLTVPKENTSFQFRHLTVSVVPP